jgi:hypothetical protein
MIQVIYRSTYQHSCWMRWVIARGERVRVLDFERERTRAVPVGNRIRIHRRGNLPDAAHSSLYKPAISSARCVTRMRHTRPSTMTVQCCLSVRLWQTVRIERDRF